MEEEEHEDEMEEEEHEVYGGEILDMEGDIDPHNADMALIFLTQAGFFNLINMYFPTFYDIKHLMKFCNSLHGGLNKLAELLEVERVGICHQAASDSLLTACTFRKLQENFFSGSMEKYAGVLYGLGVENGLH